MASRDLHNNIHLLRGIPPAAATSDNTAWVSQICDTLGYEACEFVMLTGTQADADATFTVLVEDGDDPALGDAQAVDDAFLLGTEAQAGFNYADDNEPRKIGYIGPKRYVRVTVTPANNAGSAFLAGLWLLGHARHKPSPNPPV